MSYKTNLEQLSISPTGKVASATAADSATTATSATSATSATTAQTLSDTKNYAPVLNVLAVNATSFTDSTSYGYNENNFLNTLQSKREFAISSRAKIASVDTNVLLVMNTLSYCDEGLETQQYSAHITCPGRELVLGASWNGSPESGLNIQQVCSGLYNYATHYIYFTVNGLPRVFINAASPYAYKQGGGVWGSISDSRLKQNIRELGPALDKITALHPVHFEFKNTGDDANPVGTRTGFIAQEFEQVLPGHTFEMDPMCDADKALLGEGVKAKGIEADLVPYLVKAIQELKAELDTVKAELATLKG
jgi:hypothetical protein